MEWVCDCCLAIYNKCWVGARQQSITHSNDYLQQMLSWRETTITHPLQLLFTTYVELALSNNQSLTLWLFTTYVELGLNNNQSLTLWLFTADAELPLNNNHSPTMRLFITYVELALSNNQSLTPMIIYNRCLVGAKQQSLTHSNDYLQHMLSWR
jgi:hypothetical protein